MQISVFLHAFLYLSYMLLFSKGAQRQNTAVRMNESERIQLQCYLNGVYILAISNTRILDFGSMRLWMINYKHPLIPIPSSLPGGTISSNQEMSFISSINFDFRRPP